VRSLPVFPQDLVSALQLSPISFCSSLLSWNIGINPSLFFMSDLSLCVTGNSLYLRSHSLRNYSKISRLFRQNIGLFLLSNLLLCRVFLMMTTYLLIGLVFALQPRLYFGLTPFLSNFGLNMIHWDPLISDLTKSLFDGWPFVTLRDQQRTFLLDSHLSDSF